ncbi:hypothetical protein DU000_11155, partial [Parvibium lacunae]
YENGLNGIQTLGSTLVGTLVGALGGKLETAAQTAQYSYNADVFNRQLHPAEKNLLRKLADKKAQDLGRNAQEQQDIANKLYLALEGEAAALLDKKESQQNAQYRQDLSNSQQNGLEGKYLAQKELDLMNWARSQVLDLQRQLGHQTIQLNGQDIIADGSKLQFFRSSTEQYNDSQLFNTSDRATMLRQFAGNGDANQTNAVVNQARQAARDGSVKAVDEYQQATLARMRTTNGGLATSTADLDVATLGVGGAAVKGAKALVTKVGEVIEAKLAQKAEQAAAEKAAKQTVIENNVYADNAGFANVAQREFKPGSTHRAENINAGQVTDRDGLVRVDEANTQNNKQLAEQLGYVPERWSTQRAAWKEGTLVTDRITTQPETYRMVIDQDQLKNIRDNLDAGNIDKASQSLGLWATKNEVNTLSDVRNPLAIPQEWKGRNGEKLYVIEFTVKPGAGVREGTVGPMFDKINEVELPGNGHQVNFMQNNPKNRPDLYEINIDSAKELKWIGQ